MKNPKNLILTALFAAVIAILAQIVIPLPSGVPITLQTLGIALMAYMLGVRRSLIALGVYIVLGAVGVPVFSSFRGGIGVLTGVTGGFIWGFIPMTALTALGSHYKTLPSILLGLGGMILCHAAGILQFSLISGTDIWASFLAASLPYLLKDVLCVLGAHWLAKLIKRRIKI